MQESCQDIKKNYECKMRAKRKHNDSGGLGTLGLF